MTHKPDGAAELVTSVDAYGEIGSSHILDSSQILVYGNGPNGYVIIGELKEKMSRVVPKKLLDWLDEARNILNCCITTLTANESDAAIELLLEKLRRVWPEKKP